MGLPNKVSAQLRATPKIDMLDLTAILQISKALMTEIFKNDLIKLAQLQEAIQVRLLSDVFNCGGPHYQKVACKLFCMSTLKSVKIFY